MTTTWYAATPPRRRVPLWLKAVVTVAAVCCLGAVLFVLAVVVSFSGGLDDALDFRHPEETDSRVVEAREASVARLPGVLRDLTGSSDVTLSGRSCTEGQHNFKIDDDFDLECVAVVTRVTAAPAAGQVGFAPPSGWTEVAGYGTHRTWRSGSDGSGRFELTASVEDTDSLYSYTLLGAAGGDPSAREAVAVLQSSYPSRQVLVLRLSERYFSE